MVVDKISIEWPQEVAEQMGMDYLERESTDLMAGEWLGDVYSPVGSSGPREGKYSPDGSVWP